jgi:hypothetical protein
MLVLGGYLLLLITTQFRSFENFGTKELADFMTEPVVLMREPAQEHCFCRREFDIFFLRTLILRIRTGSLIFWDNHGYEIKEPPSELMGVSCHFKDWSNIVMYLNLGFLLLGKMHNISFSVGKEGG